MDMRKVGDLFSHRRAREGYIDRAATASEFSWRRWLAAERESVRDGSLSAEELLPFMRCQVDGGYEFWYARR